MDAAGNLVIHDEVAESKEWEEGTKVPERQADQRDIAPVERRPRERGPRPEPHRPESP